MNIFGAYHRKVINYYGITEDLKFKSPQDMSDEELDSSRIRVSMLVLQKRTHAMLLLFGIIVFFVGYLFAIASDRGGFIASLIVMTIGCAIIIHAGHFFWQFSSWEYRWEILFEEQRRRAT